MNKAELVERLAERTGISQRESRAMVDAINQYDYPVVMGGVLMMAGVFVLVNLLVDLAYAWIDPRTRRGGQ